MTQGPLTPAAVRAHAAPAGHAPAAFGRRFFIALAIGLVWLAPAWWAPELIFAMLLWDIALIAAWAVDLRRIPKPFAIEAARVWSEPLTLGAAADVRVEFGNASNTMLRLFWIDDTPYELRREPPLGEVVVGAGGHGEARYEADPGQRGDLSLGLLHLSMQSLWGLAERRARADLRQTVRVLPDLRQARNQALYLIRSRQIAMEVRRRHRAGRGREFEALRDYRSGDERRDICWTATARRHALITKTYRMERNQPVWIVMDAGRLLRAQVWEPGRTYPRTKLDYAVDAALSLAQVAAQAGDRVGLIAYGRKVQQSVALGGGLPHVRQFVDALAQVRGEPTEGNHAAAVRTLMHAQTRRALVVWITDIAETATVPEVIEYAIRLQDRHVVVLLAIHQADLVALARTPPETVDRMFEHAAAIEIVERREALLRTLRERGAFALDTTPNQATVDLVNQYLEIKERSLL